MRRRSDGRRGHAARVEPGSGSEQRRSHGTGARGYRIQRRTRARKLDFAQDTVGRARPPGRVEQRRRHIRRVTRWRPGRRSGADRSLPQRRTVGGAAEADSAGNHDRRERGGLIPRRLRPARLPPDLVHRRSARRHPAAAAAGGAGRARASATAARSATARSTPSTTSPTTTAASPAESGDRSCASSMATGTVSCRRRAWWPSATR